MITSPLPMKHAARRNALGEYEYRGFVIFDTGGDRSGHSRMNRNSYYRWRVVKKTGPEFLQREGTALSRPTLAAAKKAVDSFLDNYGVRI